MEPDAQREALAHALTRTARGEAPALKEIYERTSAKLFGICLRILGEASEAEDVLQEVYVSVWRGAGGFDAGRSSPITWLAAIARNRAIDRVRRRRPGRAEPIGAAGPIADPSRSALGALEDAEQGRRLHDCLGELDEPQRGAIAGAFLDGYTYEVLARQGGVPLGTMKSWIRRALIRLRACLER